MEDMHSHYVIDGPISGPWMSFMLAGIIIGYLVIAYQFAVTRRKLNRGEFIKVDGHPAVAFRQLMYIFIFCSLSGYMPRLIDFPEWLMIVIHSLLFIFTWSYILSRQAVVIAGALIRD